MKSLPDLHQVLAIVAESPAQTPIVVATLLRAEGSTPVDAGAKAIIGPDGLMAGTIGGGAVEGEALRRAAAMLGAAFHGPPVDIFDFTLQGPGGTDPSPICGGLMRVLLQPLSGTDRCAYTAAHHGLCQRTRGILETRIANDEDASARTQWIESAQTEEHNGLFASESPRHIPAAGGGDERFLEPVMPRPLLLIAGAGHVGQAVAAQAGLLGFELAVIDDRPDLLLPEAFPSGARLIVGDIPAAVRDFDIDEDTWVVLVTRGHMADGQALAECLRRPAAYVGMIGSRRKIALMRQHFIKTGLARAEEFDRVHAPIGLDIGAVTPPEIGTSILAQIIAVRRGRSQRTNPRACPSL